MGRGAAFAAASVAAALALAVPAWGAPGSARPDPARGEAGDARATKDAKGAPATNRAPGADLATDAETDVRTSRLEDRYQSWRERYEEAGGDGSVQIGLGAVRGLSTAPPAASGSLEIDLLAGWVDAFVEGLAEPAELWLVDNAPGPGRSVLPERGDRAIRVGRFTPDGDLSAQLGPNHLRRFEVDVAVVTPAGASADATPLLLGTRSGFERRYTRERLAAAVAETAAPAGTAAAGPPGERVDPRVALGLVSPLVLQGAELFFRETFDGNGRTCGTCHPVENNQVIDPAFVSRLRRKRPDDPLFVADPGRPGGVPGLEVPELLEAFALILENVDGFEDPTVKFTLRGVPHSLSLATSLEPPGPDDGGNLPDGTTPEFEQRTGWSGDGAAPPGTLRIFPVGAVIQHFTRDVNDRAPGPGSFRLPTDEELDAMEAFMRTAGRTADLDLAAVKLRNRRAERGRVLFNTGEGGAKCFGCHADAGATASFGGNQNFDTGAERVRLARLDALGIPGDGGFGGQGLAAPNFDSNGDGAPDAFGNGGFNTPPLVEAADTGPFFHTHAFETLEEAVAFYSTPTFANSPAGAVVQAVFGEGIDLDAGQSRDVAAFLRVVNAGFNLSLAIQRAQAARAIGAKFGRAERPLASDLLRLANEELGDALRVLGEAGLHRAARREIRAAIGFNRAALRSRHARARGFYARLGERLATRAKRSLGSGLEFELGEGNLAF